MFGAVVYTEISGSKKNYVLTHLVDSIWRGMKEALKNAFYTTLAQPTLTFLEQTGHETNVLSA